MNKKTITLFKKISLSSFLVALAAPTLSGCTSDTDQSKTIPSYEPSATTSASSEITAPSSNPSDDLSVIAITDADITVDEARCIGCGKCPRFAPENFAMDPLTGKAIVISQDNASDTDVQRAKSACPTNAIQV